MGMGGPGDHPFTDVIRFHLEVYGEPADTLLRELSIIVPNEELYQWWKQNIGWQCSNMDAAKIIEKKYSQELSEK